MAYFEYVGLTYEFTTTSPSGADDWVIECVELSNPQGFFGAIVVSPEPERSEMRTEGGTLPLAVLQHWLSLLPTALEEPESDA